jgi:signal transduction histidine kinase
MVAWVSHDLRTPLAAVRALTEAWEDGVAEPDDAVKRIGAENRRMTAMVDDLLALSRLQSPTRELRREPADVGDLASDALAAAQPLADAGGVELAGEVHGSPVVAPVDAPHVARALSNLLVNAVRHTPPGRRVRVRVSAGPHGVVVQVTDACGGIPEADLPSVFDAGWRGTAARTPVRDTVPGGAGIGLAIVREVAEAHGGDVTVGNVDLPDGGRGCRFTLRLATAEPPA